MNADNKLEELTSELEKLREFFDRIVEDHECSDEEYCRTCNAIRKIDPEYGLDVDEVTD